MDGPRRVDAHRVGIFGFSLGGFTALVEVGGVPDLQRMALLCTTHPDAIQLWRAAKDEQAPEAWNSAVVRQELPTAPEEHVAPDADHFVFLAPCSDALAAAAPQICRDGPGVSR